MIRDLGQELPELASNHPDILDIIQDYGHGDCYLFAKVLAETFGFNHIIMIVDEASGIPVHSAIRLSRDRTFDAYGINKIQDTFDRYKEYVWTEVEGTATIKSGTVKSLALYTNGYEEEDREDALEAGKKLAEFLGLSLSDLAAEAGSESDSDHQYFLAA